MDRTQFAYLLRSAVIRVYREFRVSHSAEAPYAFAILNGQCGDALGYAVATEEGLRRWALYYEKSGYRYRGYEGEEFVNHEKLATWLRWENPGEGWYIPSFNDPFNVSQPLKKLVAEGAFGNNAEDLEEFCTDVLSTLQSESDWLQLQTSKPIIVGVTYGEESRDFLRTATRCNSFESVRELWSEIFRATEGSSRIKGPYD